MKAVNLDKLPTDAIPELAVFEDMAKDSKPLTSGKKAFTFVDLTHRDLAPFWLTPEAIGGKTVVPGMELELDGSLATTNLQQFSQALRKATASPRFFRTIPQWLPCFLRYATAAIASNQSYLGLDDGTYYDCFPYCRGQEGER